MNILHELLPYKQYENHWKFRYYIDYVGEAVLNPNYFGCVGGRCEVRIDEEQYAITEFRFLTDKQSFWKFRDLTECHYYNIVGLWIIKLILKYYYYDTRERIDGRVIKASERIAFGEASH